MGREPAVAVGCRVEERHAGGAVVDDALHEVPERRRHGLRVLGVVEGAPPAFLLDQADVVVAAGARRRRRRLAHEGRGEARVLDDLLDPVLEGERVVDAGHSLGVAVDQLVLGGRVFGVGRQHRDAGRAEAVDHVADRGNVVVAQIVEDVEAAEERLVRLTVEHVELVLVSALDAEAERGHPLQHAARDLAGRGVERRAVLPLGIADDLRHAIEPGHRCEGGKVGTQRLVLVLDLLVVEGARNHVGGGVEGDDAAIHVHALAGGGGEPLDRHLLRACGAVHVRQLEADMLDFVALEPRQRLLYLIAGALPSVIGHGRLLFVTLHSPAARAARIRGVGRRESRADGTFASLPLLRRRRGGGAG